MRTTLTIDDDVAKQVEERRRGHDSTLKEEINHLLRVGLLHADESPDEEPYRTRTFSMGKQLMPLDNIHEVLDALEGPWRR